MADIAFIFHWPPDQLLAMRAGQILDWRDKARRRWNQAYGGDQ
ncbi:MAG: GpE family phage tail protein [Ectothiorhodospiraceae bacterium]|jgi:hypothetical protein|nr:GpE family phage tail protein [Ectothiorhodospiraceae bacterium]